MTTADPDERKNIDSEDDDDVLNSNRVHSRHQAHTLKKALASNPDAFVSFSEGMATVDKFELIYDSMTSMQALPAISKSSQSIEFESFSQGLANVDKFELVHSSGFAANINSITSFAQAADLLVQLAQMSSTLSRLLSGVKEYPWLKEVAVEWKQDPPFKDFCTDNHLLVLDTNSGVAATLLDLCHQLYHVANPCLSRLYGKTAVDQATYTDVLLWNETAALITEICLRQELGLFEAEPVQILIQGEKNTNYWLDIEQYIFESESDLNALRKILPKAMTRGSLSQNMNEWLSVGYESYIGTFKQRCGLIRS